MAGGSGGTAALFGRWTPADRHTAFAFFSEAFSILQISGIFNAELPARRDESRRLFPAIDHLWSVPMKKAAKEILDERLTNRVRMEKEAPELFQGFRELMKAYYKKGALSIRYKELMAVTASVATVCAPALAYHINNAIAHGASRKEMIEAATIGVKFGGGPALVMVRDHLLEYMDALEADAGVI